MCWCCLEVPLASRARSTWRNQNHHVFIGTNINMVHYGAKILNNGWRKPLLYTIPLYIIITIIIIIPLLYHYYTIIIPLYIHFRKTWSAGMCSCTSWRKLKCSQAKKLRRLWRNSQFQWWRRPHHLKTDAYKRYSYYSPCIENLCCAYMEITQAQHQFSFGEYGILPEFTRIIHGNEIMVTQVQRVTKVAIQTLHLQAMTMWASPDTQIQRSQFCHQVSIYWCYQLGPFGSAKCARVKHCYCWRNFRNKGKWKFFQICTAGMIQETQETAGWINEWSVYVAP